MSFRSLVLFGGFFAIAMFVLCEFMTGCGQPKTPREQARSVVLTVAEGVRQADLTCAGVAKADQNVDLAMKCANIVKEARTQLITAEDAVDAWDRGAAGDVPCAIRSAVDALTRLIQTIRERKVDIPPAVDDALRLAPLLTGACHG